MNTAHLVAWLTCIALAFFACILGVWNAGGVLALERQVEEMDRKLEAGPQGSAGVQAELDRIRRSLDKIGEEIKALHEVDISVDLQQRLEKLHREFQDRLSALPEADEE